MSGCCSKLLVRAHLSQRSVPSPMCPLLQDMPPEHAAVSVPELYLVWRNCKQCSFECSYSDLRYAFLWEIHLVPSCRGQCAENNKVLTAAVNVLLLSTSCPWARAGLWELCPKAESPSAEAEALRNSPEGSQGQTGLLAPSSGLHLLREATYLHHPLFSSPPSPPGSPAARPWGSVLCTPPVVPTPGEMSTLLESYADPT